MLDFKLIANGEEFELLCEELLRAEGLTIIKRPSRGPDSGADMIASTSKKDALGFEEESKILVECKHYAHSGRSVRESNTGSIVERTISNNCNKYLLITSTVPSSGLAKQIQAISSNPSIPIAASFWSKNDIEGRLQAYTALIDRFFPAEVKSFPLKPVETPSGHIIAVHLHPDFSSELQDLIELWNSKQTHIEFVSIRPPREIEGQLLKNEELECQQGLRLAKQIKLEAGFSDRDGIIIFYEGRLFSEEWYQLFSDNLPFASIEELDCSIISLHVKRSLVPNEKLSYEWFAMVVQSMLYALGIAAGLDYHTATRTCIMDFNNEMSDILLGIKYGPKFCPTCKRALQEHKHLLVLAEEAQKFVHVKEAVERVPIRMRLRDERQERAEKYEYDIVLSFAGEDRKYAAELADSLDKKGVNVFYDDFEKDLLWGEDLYTYLDELYRFKAKYCVAFLSKNYAAKMWTNHERKSAQSRAFTENRPYILPIRLDATEIPGIRPTVAYLTWNNESAESIAEILVKKLGTDD